MGSDTADKNKKKSIAVIAWNGVQQPCAVVDFDTSAAFTILLFNYSGNGLTPPASDSYYYDLLINQRTEFKGHLLRELYAYLKDNDSYQYIGIIDDDIRIKISDINQLLSIAEANQLDSFQPSLTHDSDHSFQFNLHQAGVELLSVPWVEIMCPFYRKELFDACYPLCEDNITSYGIDKYAVPFYQQLLNMKSTAVIHAVQITHLKVVTDGDKRFSNGLTARQEGERLRKAILYLIRTEYAETFTKETVAAYFDEQRNGFDKLKDGVRVFMKDVRAFLNKG